MALPRAFATLGLLVGGGLLTVVFGLSFFSLTALVQAAKTMKCWTYAELARVEFGKAGSTALQAAIVVNNSGSMIMAVLCIVALAPLLSLRNLSLLAPMSTAAVAVAGLFVSSIVGLAITAAWQGQLGDFQWLPTADMLGHSPMRVIINLLAVLPVITMSFVCHYNLLPVVS